MIIQKIVRRATLLWPFQKGRYRLKNMLLNYSFLLPEKETFRFSFGVFVNAPIKPWPFGFLDLYLFGVMDENELEIWRRVLKPGDKVIDAGANWGYWSLVASYLVGSKGAVYSFEPIPNTYQNLINNLKASSATNVITKNIALLDNDLGVTVHVAHNDEAGLFSSIGYLTHIEMKDNIECKSCRLDQYDFKGFIKLIKLDVEGSELQTLKGARKLLESEERPIITFEWNCITASAMGYHPNEILHFLKAYGYDFYVSKNKKLVKLVINDNTDWTPMIWAITPRQIECIAK